MYNNGKLWVSTTAGISKVRPSYHEDIETYNITDHESSDSHLSIKNFNSEEFTQIIKNCKKGYR